VFHIRLAVEDGAEFIAALNQGFVAILAFLLGFDGLIIFTGHEDAPLGG